MFSGFPKNFINSIICSNDGGVLRLPDKNNEKNFILNGSLICEKCQQTYKISNGILSIVSNHDLSELSAFEMNVRNQYAQNEQEMEDYLGKPNHAWEMIPTLDALENLQNKNVLELGCGTGRYSLYITKSCKQLVALDFSFEALKVLASRLGKNDNVVLIHADISKMKFCKSIFDIVFSTLVSNLPSKNYLDAMFKLALNSMQSNGKFVFSAHHYTLKDIIFRNPKSGKYKENKIYRYYFTSKEILKDTKKYFNDIKIKPIYIRVPWLGRLNFPVVKISLFLSKMPVIRNLGELLLVSATNPVPHN